MRRFGVRIRSSLGQPGGCGGRKNGSIRGASLIETMFALGLFTTGLAVVTGMTREIAYTNELSQQIATATTLARNKFEDIRTRDPEERTTLGVTSGSAGPLDATGDPAVGGRYSIQWVIEESVPHSGMERVTIYVRWLDARGTDRSYEFTSGLRKGWPVPVVYPSTSTDHAHGSGHQK